MAGILGQTIVRPARGVVAVPARGPVIEAVEVPGQTGATGRDGATLGSAVIVQASPSAVWTLNHGLGRFPGVTLVDTAGDCFDGDLRYVDPNTIVVTLIAPTAGTAYLN